MRAEILVGDCRDILPTQPAASVDSIVTDPPYGLGFMGKGWDHAVPGREFGMEGYLRLSYAGTIKEIQEGIARIKWALDPSAPNEIYVGEKKLVRDWL